MKTRAVSLGAPGAVGDDHLDHEVSSRLQVSRGVGEDCELFTLGGDIYGPGYDP